MSNPIMRDSLSGADNNFEDNHQLEEVLTARNDFEHDEDGLENAMFEVAKNSRDDVDHDDQLGNDLEDGNLNDAVGDDFMSEGSFREVVQDIKGQMESSDKKVGHDNFLLKQQLEEAERTIKSLKEELELTKENLANHEDESTVIAHIKGTLIQFLKNLPLTDLKNEELLKIIYSMMEFTTDEINELYNQRVNVKVNSKQKPGQKSTTSTGAAQNNTSSSFTGNIDEEAKEQ